MSKKRFIARHSTRKSHLLALALCAILSGCVHAQSVQLGGSAGVGGTVGIQTSPPPALQIAPSTCPAGTLNQAYIGCQFTASNAIGAVSWSVSAGSLPNGLTLNGSGLIGGTPIPNAGSFAATIKAVDAAGNQALDPVTIAIGCPKFSADPIASLPPASTSTAYNFTFQPQGGISPYTCTLAGSLPIGEALSSCVISGTPTVAGNYSFSVTFGDSCNLGSQTATAPYSELVNSTVAVTTSQLPNATLGVAYPGAQLTATGGTGPYSFTVTGNLPPGITVASNGAITGTDSTQNGTFTFSVVAKDSLSNLSQPTTLSITVTSAPLLISNTNPLCGGTQNQPYSCQMSATGGFGTLTWSGPGLTSCGLTINGSTGLISGTATCVGTFSPTITVKDSTPGTPQSVSQVFDIPIAAPAPGPLKISNPNPLPTVTVGTFFQMTFNATGGVSPYSWATDGNQPTGLSVSTAGVESGTPTVPGTFTPTITVTDSQPVSTPVTFTQTAVCPNLTITGPATLGPWTQGTAITPVQIGTSGSFGTVMFSIAGFPSGISISPTGQLSGIPGASGTFAASVTITDGCTGAPGVTKNYSVVVTSNLAVTTPSIPNGTVGVAYSATISGAGGTPPYSCSSSSLPTDGLSLSSCTISGTPSTAQTLTLSGTLSDSASHSVPWSYTITISPANPPPPTTVALPQNWVNSHACDGTLTAPNQTISFPSSWTGGGPYTNNAAGLQSAVNDAETYRKNHLASGAVLINIAAGSLFTSNGHTLTLPQTTGDTSTNCIALATTGTLPAGRTVGSHGTQDNVAESTDPGVRNPGVNNDVGQMFAIETSGAAGGATALNTGPVDANGTAPHNYLIVGAEFREASSDTSKVQVLVMLGNTNLNETAASQLPSAIYIDRSWFHNFCLDNQTGCTSGILHVFVPDCGGAGCSVENSQFSQNIYGGQQSQDIFIPNSAGPIKIVHNWIESSAQQIICGGNPTFFGNPLQSCNDLEIRRNYITYPAAWLGSTFKPGGQSPNRIAAVELKSANRILFDGNIVENVDDSGAQFKPFTINPKAYNNVTPQYYVTTSNLTYTSNIFRHVCNQGAWFTNRSAAAPNGNGVSMPETLINFSNNLAYDISRPSFCSNQDSAGGDGLQVSGSDVQFTCSAARDSAGKTVTLACANSGTGMAQTDTSIGDPILVSGCADTTFNTGLSDLVPGPVALAGTNPNGLTVVYANTGTANATTTGCKFDNFQAYPMNSTFSHNTIISNGFGLYATLPHGIAGGSLFIKLNTIQNNIFLGGISGQGLSDTSTPTAQGANWDLTSSVFSNNLYPGRKCTAYADVLSLGGTVVKPPSTSACPTSLSFLSTSFPTPNVNLADWNGYALALTSPFKSGGTSPASDGTDRGISAPSINNAETRTQYVCSTSCGSGPFPD